MNYVMNFLPKNTPSMIFRILFSSSDTAPPLNVEFPADFVLLIQRKKCMGRSKEINSPKKLVLMILRLLLADISNAPPTSVALFPIDFASSS